MFAQGWLRAPSAMQRITPFLWFDDQAAAAANFHVSVFKNSKGKDFELAVKIAEWA